MGGIAYLWDLCGLDRGVREGVRSVQANNSTMHCIRMAAATSGTESCILCMF